MEYGIDESLVAFIQARPEGNLLREIAERVLMERRKDAQVKVLPIRNEARVFSRGVIRLTVAGLTNDQINMMCRKNIATVRVKHNVSKATMARKLGTTRERLRDWENGVFKVPLPAVVKICLTYGIAIEDFTTTLL